VINRAARQVIRQVLMALVALCCLQLSAAERPNILLLLADDMGYGDFLSRDGAFQSPALRRLAAQGVTFTRHYTDAVCGPSRASLLSGLSASALGYRADAAGLPTDLPTLPRSLQTAGYLSWHVGKWHLGHRREAARPPAQGFDRWYGFLSQYLLQHEQRPDAFRYARPTYEDPYLGSDEDFSRRTEGHLSDLLVARTLDLIRRGADADRPWFINHWFYLPHQPLEPAARFVSPGATPAQRYAAQLVQFDELVEQVLHVLAETGQAGETLVILTSDNGGTNLARANNGPLAGAKGAFSEGGLRLPLILRLPGVLPAGERRSAVVSLRDLYPTVLALAGLSPVPGLEGENLLPAMGEPGWQRRQPLSWEAPFLAGQAVSVLSRDGRWRYTAYREPGEPPVETLYDLEADESGAENVAAENPVEVSRLRQHFDQWARSVHQLPLHFEPTGSGGHGVLSGRDLQRLPGHGPFTFALSFRGDDPAAAQQTLAGQAGAWEMIYSARESSLRLEIGEGSLSATLPPDSRCHSVMIAGYFRVQLSPRSEDVGEVRLFLDGRLADRARVEGPVAAKADIAAVTRIGLDAQGRRYAGELASAAQFNVVPERYPWLSPQARHDDGCAGPGP
jgi:arylsulfatase A-like enzyme